MGLLPWLEIQMPTTAPMHVSWVATELRALRDRAGINKKGMAAALGMPFSSYQHYEDRYKEAYFPGDFVLRLMPILTAKGIPPEEIAALAGPHPISDYAADRIESLLVQVDTLHSELAHLKRALKPNS
jgi:hypothetical protein